MTQTIFDHYTMAGDVAVIAICLIIAILLVTSYISRTRIFGMYLNIISMLAGAAIVNIIYHHLLTIDPLQYRVPIYVLRIMYHAMLFDIFFLFAIYTAEVARLNRSRTRCVTIFSCSMFVGFVLIDIIGVSTGFGFRIAEDGTVSDRMHLFMIGYVSFLILLIVLMNWVQDFVYIRVMYGFYGTMVVAAVIRFGQLPLNQTSLTTMTFVFPAIAMLYIIHSNPYNVSLGTLDSSAMKDMIRTMYARKEQFVFIGLNLLDYEEEGRELPEDIRAVIRKYSSNYFRKSVLFRHGNGHMILIVPLRCNPDYEERIRRIHKSFDQQYEFYQLSYKAVIGRSIDEISRKNEYISLIKSIERDMPENSVRQAGPEDIARFNREEYILHELADICRRHDLDDPRVLAYCQPVYNIHTGRFDTAEALMRLKLEETGIVFPDQFIHVAENQGYIHMLTEIILHKTCKELHSLIEEGFMITRISVNVSVIELKEEEFCGDINRIIGGNSVPGDKVAIELTESRSEADFEIMKEKIEQLRGQGIKFYLDDFGTGYSNMERIMELPFDIIKFDRSLVIASSSGGRSGKIVENLAQLFRDMDYSVLYEGVEDETDENRCRGMSASYLQGYKYSRPIPIENLRQFLSKAG